MPQQWEPLARRERRRIWTYMEATGADHAVPVWGGPPTFIFLGTVAEWDVAVRLRRAALHAAPPQRRHQFARLGPSVHVTLS